MANIFAVELRLRDSFGGHVHNHTLDPADFGLTAEQLAQLLPVQSVLIQTQDERAPWRLEVCHLEW